MKRQRIFIVLFLFSFALFCSNGLSMDANTAEEIAMTVIHADEAKEALAFLKEQKAAEVLVRIIKARSTRPGIRLEAIRLVGEIGDASVAEPCLHLLYISSGGVMGGTEQQFEHQQKKKALVETLSKLCDVEPTNDLSYEGIREYLVRCRAALKSK